MVESSGEVQFFSYNNPLIAKLLKNDGRLFDVASAGAVLSWDEEAYMPKGGADSRACVTATIATLHHKLLTSKKLARLIERLENALQANPHDFTTHDHLLLQRMSRDHRRATKVSAALVEKISKAHSEGLLAWRKARGESNFKLFQEALAKVVELEKERAVAIGFQGSIYNYFLDEHEPGLKVEDVGQIFEAIKVVIKEVLLKVVNSGITVNQEFLKSKLPEEKLGKFCEVLARAMGFDFDRGKMDVTTHPMTTSFTQNDVRFSVRYTEEFFTNVIFSAIHEAGHGLYEQGIDSRFTRTSLGCVESLGVHESQSRFWENCVGRSPMFWDYWYPVMLSYVPEILSSEVKPMDFVRAVNKVEPTLIRVDADEVTYNLHIILRYEIERDLLEGKISVKDLPEVWNAKVKEYLGIPVPDDKRGVLQDIHWADGSFGYFPTYTLGNLYAAQIFAAIKRSLGENYFDRAENYADMRPIQEWLREKIHGFGATINSRELIKLATGEEPNPKYFRDYLEEKFNVIYGW
ncbi:MAG: carboxypeptidase M32 [Candidatus Liptonbacteria bacterium]|nr:carboxypeptidase M32 [Candidatus Liptonbacteria bacterium]